MASGNRTTGRDVPRTPVTIFMADEAAKGSHWMDNSPVFWNQQDFISFMTSSDI